MLDRVLELNLVEVTPSFLDSECLSYIKVPAGFSDRAIPTDMTDLFVQVFTINMVHYIVSFNREGECALDIGYINPFMSLRLVSARHSLGSDQGPSYCAQACTGRPRS